MTSPPSEAAELLAALHFAAAKHRDHRRKDADASPYINHPIEVAELLARVGRVTDLEVLRAAILHDTIEDTATSEEDLYASFGPVVAALVAEVSDDKLRSKEERKRLQIEHAASLSCAAKLVKLADKICNVRDIADAPPAGWSQERRLEYFDWARAVIEGCRGVNEPLERCFAEAVARAEAKVRGE